MKPESTIPAVQSGKYINYAEPEPKTNAIKSKPRPFWQLFLQIFGNLSVVAGLIYLFLWSYPVVMPQILYQLNRWRGVTFAVSTEPNSSSQNQSIISLIDKPKEPLRVVPVSTEFGIVIEKINANAPIIENVDAGNYTEYIEALQRGVAHAKGTVLPGQNGNLFLFSHSTYNVFEISKYNAVFTLLNKLEIGDKVVIFYKGQRYDYMVNSKKVVDPSDVTPLTAQYDSPVLTLQTCDPPGTDLNRLIVTADLID